MPPLTLDVPFVAGNTPARTFRSVDLIFMDINMIGIDGCTTTNIIKENYCKNNIKVPVIATTGNIMAKIENHNDTPTENKYICFDNIIIKPYDEDNILSILNSYLT